MPEGSLARVHCLKMINVIEKFEKLGFAIDGELSINLVLQFLPDNFSQFVIKFKMNRLEATFLNC